MKDCMENGKDITEGGKCNNCGAHGVEFFVQEPEALCIV